MPSNPALLRAPAQLIAAVQQSTGLSQRALASALGVSQSTVHRWIVGDRPLDGPARRLLELAADDPGVLGTTR